MTRAEKPISGTTLIETLLAGSVLLLLTGIFFKSVVPLWQKSDWYMEEHGQIRHFIAAREKLSNRLRPAIFVPTDEIETPNPTAVLYFVRPQESETSEGILSDVDGREVLILEEDRVRELRFENGLLYETDGAGSYKSLIWKVGSAGDVQVSLTEENRVATFEVEGTNWSYTIKVRSR